MRAKTIFFPLLGLFLCLLAAWLYGYDYMLAYAPTVPDFESYYLAAQAWQRGMDPYVFQNLAALKTDTATGPPFPYLYTPPTAQAVTVMARLPFADAARIWGTLLVLAYGLCLFLAGRLCYAAGRRLGWIPATCFHEGLCMLAVLALGPVFPYRVNLACGQVNIFILLLLLGYVWLYVQEKPFWAGLALGVASVLKLVPVFLLLAHIRSPRSFWVGFVGGVAGVLALSVAFFGILPWRQFFEALPHFSYGTRVEGLFEISVPYNIAFSGQWARLFHDHARSVFLAGFLGGLLLLGYYFFSSQKITDGSPAFFLRMGAATVLMVLFSPIAYMHHLVWLLAPVLLYVLYLLYGGVRRRWVWLAVLAVILVFSLVDFTVKYYTLPFTAKLPFYFSINALALSVLAGMMLVSAHRAARGKG